MDIRVLELATRITEKAMGTDSTLITWINDSDKVQEFLKATAETLDKLYRHAA
jgi:hypothetical protein